MPSRATHKRVRHEYPLRFHQFGWKGLGFVPDYQALTAWDDAERKRRQTA